jgi:hypothetical protein
MQKLYYSLEASLRSELIIDTAGSMLLSVSLSMSLYVSFLGDYASKYQNSLAGKLQYMKFNASFSLFR